MVNVGQMMVWVIGANLQFEIFHFLAVVALVGGKLLSLLLFFKFPLESAILGRFQKFDTFFNSE